MIIIWTFVSVVICVQHSILICHAASSMIFRWILSWGVVRLIIFISRIVLLLPTIVVRWFVIVLMILALIIWVLLRVRPSFGVTFRFVALIFRVLLVAFGLILTLILVVGVWVICFIVVVILFVGIFLVVIILHRWFLLRILIFVELVFIGLIILLIVLRVRILLMEIFLFVSVKVRILHIIPASWVAILLKNALAIELPTSTIFEIIHFLVEIPL